MAALASALMLKVIPRGQLPRPKLWVPSLILARKPSSIGQVRGINNSLAANLRQPATSLYEWREDTHKNTWEDLCQYEFVMETK
jgi:hypothetical protein